MPTPSPTVPCSPRAEVAQSGLSKHQHVIIAGFGRTGQTCARFLKLEEIPFLALDLDPERVSEAKLAGRQVAFGDASRRDILLAAGLLRARLVIITFDDRKRVDAMLTLIRELAGRSRCWYAPGMTASLNTTSRPAPSR
nr:NAD(P)-binding protein [Aeromonas caviae]